MTEEELGESIGFAISNVEEDLKGRLLDLIKERIESEAQRLLQFEVLKKMIDESSIVHRKLLEWMNSWVANEVGNRLRCGVYNGTGVDKLFESIWTEQLDIAIKDRIRSKVYKAIDDVIAEKLKRI